ncbi:MAG: HAD hydrolase family protein, partial [Halioglobus sp.]
FARDRGLRIADLNDLSSEAKITNISALGEAQAIDSVAEHVAQESHLIAYAGIAIEGEGWHWIDVHHNDASKGGAIELLKKDLGVSRVICFGDSDNDLSMFAMADECYAPSNAKAPVLAAATAVIGHHDEDGVSQFLRERFKL